MTSRLYIFEGRDQVRVFALEHQKIYTIGRSPNNDIQIQDKNISSYHLKVIRKQGKFFITDLKTENGTFVAGSDIEPEIEIEVGEGNPIVIGMTVIGLGDSSITFLKPILDSIGIYNDTPDENDRAKSCRVRTFKRNLQFIYNINDILLNAKDINEITIKIIAVIFDLLKRIDRCSIILTDPDTGNISDVIYRTRAPVDGPEKAYDLYIVEQALRLNKAIFIPDSFDTIEDDEDDIVDHLKQTNIRSVMCVPLCSYFHTSGTIYLDSIEKPHGFRRSDFDLMKDVSSRVALSMDNISINNSIGPVGSE